MTARSTFLPGNRGIKFQGRRTPPGSNGRERRRHPRCGSVQGRCPRVLPYEGPVTQRGARHGLASAGTLCAVRLRRGARTTRSLTVQPEAGEATLVEAVVSRARDQAPDQDTGLLHEEFVRRYYDRVPEEELAARDPANLCRAALAHLELLSGRRGPGSALRVYNPAPDRDGWRSPHTVVEIVSDDMPFLVDSVTMELDRQGHAVESLIHPVMAVQRDASGAVRGFGPLGAPNARSESVIHVEVAREPDAGGLRHLEDGLHHVLDDVAAAVADWPAMLERMEEAIADLGRRSGAEGAEEAGAFLRWLADDQFVFLGSREYELVREHDEDHLRAVGGSGLGILRGD